MSVEQWPLKPGDLFYSRTPVGIVHTDVLWTVDENEGVATNVSAEMPPGTYETVRVRCDGTCQITGCQHGRTQHSFLLSAGDYIHASRSAEFEVQR